VEVTRASPTELILPIDIGDAVHVSVPRRPTRPTYVTAHHRLGKAMCPAYDLAMGLQSGVRRR
jgi:hypothetical protein